MFDAVARTGSLTAAAQDLEISQPAVSRHMRALTAELGVALYRRAGRSITLTADGRLLAESVTGAFTAIEASLERIDGARDALLFAVQPAMATSWVVPLLDQLETAAGCEIRLRIYDRVSELHEGAWDLAIVPGNGSWPAWTATRLFSESVRPLASPSLADELGLDASSEPADLARANLLHIDDVERPSMTWQDWFAESGSATEPPPPRLVYNAYPTVIQEALAGNGVALGWKHLLSDLVERGLLVAVGPSVERGRTGHYLCWPGDHEDGRSRAVLDRLQRAIGDPS